MSLLCSMLHVSIHSKVNAIQNSTEVISYLWQLSLLFPLHYIMYKIIPMCVFGSQHSQLSYPVGQKFYLPDISPQSKTRLHVNKEMIDERGDRDVHECCVCLSCDGHVCSEVCLRYKQMKQLCFFCLLLLTVKSADNIQKFSPHSCPYVQ